MDKELRSEVSKRDVKSKEQKKEAKAEDRKESKEGSPKVQDAKSDYDPDLKLPTEEELEEIRRKEEEEKR